VLGASARLRLPWYRLLDANSPGRNGAVPAAVQREHSLGPGPAPSWPPEPRDSTPGATLSLRFRPRRCKLASPLRNRSGGFGPDCATATANAATAPSLPRRHPPAPTSIMRTTAGERCPPSRSAIRHWRVQTRSPPRPNCAGFRLDAFANESLELLAPAETRLGYCCTERPSCCRLPFPNRNSTAGRTMDTLLKKSDDGRSAIGGRSCPLGALLFGSPPPRRNPWPQRLPPPRQSHQGDRPPRPRPDSVPPLADNPFSLGYKATEATLA
jgi:hypothetical protein